MVGFELISGNTMHPSILIYISSTCGYGVEIYYIARVSCCFRLYQVYLLGLEQVYKDYFIPMG